jgi:hypothetical protein
LVIKQKALVAVGDCAGGYIKWAPIFELYEYRDNRQSERQEEYPGNITTWNISMSIPRQMAS